MIRPDTKENTTRNCLKAIQSLILYRKEMLAVERRPPRPVKRPPASDILLEKEYLQLVIDVLDQTAAQGFLVHYVGKDPPKDAENKNELEKNYVNCQQNRSKGLRYPSRKGIPTISYGRSKSNYCTRIFSFITLAR